MARLATKKLRPAEETMEQRKPVHASKRPRHAGRHQAMAALGGVVTFALVFGLSSVLVHRLATAHYPAPEQAAVWSMIGQFVAATLAVAAAAQAWWWLRHR
jgi:hypothetical protein